MSSYPKVSMQTYQSKNLSIIRLKKLILTRRWKDVNGMIIHNPQLANDIMTRKHSNGERNEFSPLHLACSRKPPIEIVLQLLASNISAIKERDLFGYLPIHNACRFNATHEVCRTLIAVHPDGASTRAVDGALPLHLACLYGKDTHNVDVLINAYSGAVDRWDDMGLTPLDYASDNPHPNKLDILLALTKIKRKESYESFNYIKALNDTQEDSSDTEEDFDDAFRRFNTYTKKHDSKDFFDTYEPDRKASKSVTKSCVVCMDKDVSRILLPCGHPCLCDKCSTDHSMSQMKWCCPECRAPVREVAKVFGRVVVD